MYKGYIQDENELNEIIKILKSDETDSLNNRKERYLKQKKSRNFILIDNVLYFKSLDEKHKRVFARTQTSAMKLEVSRLHKESHVGMNKLEELCNDFYFKIPRTIIREVVAECNVCLQSQPLKKKDDIKNITCKYPSERYQMDMVDLSSFSNENDGFSWILVIVDIYSKYGIARKLCSKSADNVCRELENVFYTFGPPTILQSDNGKEFSNTKVEELCKRFKIKFIHGRVKHPQSQGQVERLNQTLTRMIQKNIFEQKNKRWIETLEKVVYNYNITFHSATKKTPFILFLGKKGFNTVFLPEDNSDCFEVVDNSEVYNCVEQLEIEKKEDIHSIDPVYLKRMNKNASVHSYSYNFNKGDYVFIQKDFDNNQKTKKRKLESFYEDVGIIKEILSNNRLLIELKGNDVIINMARVKKANNPQ